MTILKQNSGYLLYRNNTMVRKFEIITVKFMVGIILKYLVGGHKMLKNYNHILRELDHNA